MTLKSFLHRLNERHERLILGMISKKFFAWWVVTYFFWIKRIPAEPYLYFTAAVFALQIVQNRVLNTPEPPPKKEDTTKEDA